MKKIVYIVIISACLFFSPPVSAQVKLSISPARQEIIIAPGEKKYLSVTLYNNSSQKIAGTLYITGFILKEGDIFPRLLPNDIDENPFSAASWIRLPYKQLVIPTMGKTEIPLLVTVPEQISPGGHYAALVFQENTKKNTNNINGSTTSAGIAGLLNFTVSGEIYEKLDISFSKMPEVIEYGPISARFNINNRGTVHIKPIIQIALYNSKGRKIEQKNITSPFIFPQNLHKYTVPIGKKYLFGPFKIQARAYYGKGRVVEETLLIWVIPWKICVFLLFLIVIGTLVLYRHRLSNKSEKIV